MSEWGPSGRRWNGSSVWLEVPGGVPKENLTYTTRSRRGDRADSPDKAIGQAEAGGLWAGVVGGKFKGQARVQQTLNS